MQKIPRGPAEPIRLTLTMNNVVARFSRHTQKLLAAMDLNLHAARVLIQLMDNASLRCGDLADRGGIDPTVLSHVLRPLEKRGLIFRERGKKDNREIEVRLTAKGKTLAAQCRKLDDATQKSLLTGIPVEDQNLFIELLEQIEQNVIGFASDRTKP